MLWIQDSIKSSSEGKDNILDTPQTVYPRYIGHKSRFRLIETVQSDTSQLEVAQKGEVYVLVRARLQFRNKNRGTKHHQR